MLDLDFTPEQELLKSTVRDLLGRHCSFKVIREMEDDPIGYPPELWQQMGDLDLVGLLLPEEFGGAQMSLVEGVALYEELGRALAPVPHLVSAVLCGGVLSRAGSQTQKQEWLFKVATGESVLTPAWLEPEGGYSPAGVQTTATKMAGGYTITGTKRHVYFAKAADQFVVLARTGEGQGKAIDLFLVDPNAPGVQLTQQFSIASDTQYEVELRDVAVSEADRIGPVGSGWDVWQEVLQDALVLLAAQAIGGARYALEITNQYAKDRQQFDKPLGAFQALAHYLADAVTEIDGGEQLVHEAAWARANGRSIEQLAPMAKLFACQVFRDTTATAQQIFGGIGFTLDFDIQLYFRRAKALQLMWADGRTLEEQVATAIFD